MSPADSTFVGAWAIGADSHITVKSLRWSLDELLADSPTASAFAVACSCTAFEHH